MKLFFLTSAGSVALALVLACPAVANAATDERPAQGQQGQLPTMRVDELTGEKVINDKGEEIGEIDAVVRDKSSKKLFAVIAVGGFLGIGEHDVTIGLEDLTMQGKRVQAPAGTTRDQLKNMPEYDERQYDELPGDQVVTIGSRAGSHGGSR